MSDCKGKGTCFKDCFCNEDDEICYCGHRIHGVRYCRKEPCIHNCEMIKCKNFDTCGQSSPQWAMDMHPGGHFRLCFDCWAYRGEMKKTSQPENCSICYEDKIVVELSCHSTHKLCLECWDKTINYKRFPSECPLCRKVIGAWKRNSH